MCRLCDLFRAKSRQHVLVRLSIRASQITSQKLKATFAGGLCSFLTKSVNYKHRAPLEHSRPELMQSGPRNVISSNDIDSRQLNRFMSQRHESVVVCNFNQ